MVCTDQGKLFQHLKHNQDHKSSKISDRVHMPSRSAFHQYAYTSQDLWTMQKACGRMGMVRTVFSSFAVISGIIPAGTLLPGHHLFCHSTSCIIWAATGPGCLIDFHKQDLSEELFIFYVLATEKCILSVLNSKQGISHSDMRKCPVVITFSLQ